MKGLRDNKKGPRCRTSLVVHWLRLQAHNAGQSLVGELGSRMPLGMAQRNQTKPKQTKNPEKP